MRAIKHTSAFKKDYKRIQKRGWSREKLSCLLGLLVTDASLPSHARPHKLVGRYANLWECHVEPDWLLIYEYGDDGALVLRRTGSHADLFK